ncbi:PRC-barrel domain-containing protein [Maritalea sp.]|uniref:PRC-barrel domain-containing protein n=1 Tax=Maritalea sp. TaxID=2003361 RepID=UPI003EF54F1C
MTSKLLTTTALVALLSSSTIAFSQTSASTEVQADTSAETTVETPAASVDANVNVDANADANAGTDNNGSSTSTTQTDANAGTNSNAATDNSAGTSAGSETDATTSTGTDATVTTETNAATQSNSTQSSDDSANSNSDASSEGNSTTNTQVSSDSDVMLSQDWIGKPIYSSASADAEVYGDVNDVVAGESGVLKWVIVGVGGFLGMGEKNVAISIDYVNWAETDDGRRVLVTSVSKAELEAAEPFDRDKMAK